MYQEATEDYILVLVRTKMPGFGIEVPTPGDDVEMLWRLWIQEARRFILNYCNLRQVPEGLNYVWSGIVCDFIRWQAAVALEGEGSSGQTTPGTSSGKTYVSQVHLGDTTVEYKQEEVDADAVKDSSYRSPVSGHSIDLDSVGLNYLSQLHRYRRMVWPS